MTNRYLEVESDPHDLFEPDEYDIYLQLPCKSMRDVYFKRFRFTLGAVSVVDLDEYTYETFIGAMSRADQIRYYLTSLLVEFAHITRYESWELTVQTYDRPKSSVVLIILSSPDKCETVHLQVRFKGNRLRKGGTLVTHQERRSDWLKNQIIPSLVRPCYCGNHELLHDTAYTAMTEAGKGIFRVYYNRDSFPARFDKDVVAVLIYQPHNELLTISDRIWRWRSRLVRFFTMRNRKAIVKPLAVKYCNVQS